jgi:predicted Zn-dependent peptidase
MNRTAKQIAEEIDDVGGHLNAVTARDYTCYFAKVPDKHVRFAIDIICDIVCRPMLRESDIEKEKGVIAEEISMYEDSPEEIVHDLLASTAWGHNSLGLPILGSDKTMGNLTRNDIVTYMSGNYLLEGTVISVAGNIKHDEVVEEVSKHLNLSKIPMTSCTTPAWKPGTFAFRSKSIEQAHLCIGYESFGRRHPDRFGLYILDVAVGGGLSSRLFQKLREDQGLVYSTYSYAALYEDTGAFVVYAGTSVENIQLVKDLILEELGDICSNGLKWEEYNRGKEQLKNGLALNLETTNSRMSRLGRLELAGEPLRTPDEAGKIIDNVTYDDVSRIAGELLSRELPVIAVAGPRKTRSFLVRREQYYAEPREETADTSGSYRGFTRRATLNDSPITRET